jgi:hypothetical protein
VFGGKFRNLGGTSWTEFRGIYEASYRLVDHHGDICSKSRKLENDRRHEGHVVSQTYWLCTGESQAGERIRVEFRDHSTILSSPAHGSTDTSNGRVICGRETIA